MNVTKTKEGLMVRNEFYSARLFRRGGRIISLLHTGSGAEFVSFTRTDHCSRPGGIAKELECGHPGQMARDDFQEEILVSDDTTLCVRYTYHGRPGFFIRWSMKQVKTYTFRQDSPLIQVEQTLHNAGEPELFAEYRIHNELLPGSKRVILMPTGSGLQHLPSTEGGGYIHDFTEACSGIWHTDTECALFFLPEYDAVDRYLIHAGKHLATIEWYYRSFTLGENAAWTTSYSILPMSLTSINELPGRLSAAGFQGDIHRRDRRPPATTTVQTGSQAHREREDAKGPFANTVASQAARKAAFAAPAYVDAVSLPDGTLCHRAIQAPSGAGWNVALPGEGPILVKAEAAWTQAGPGRSAVYLGCCDPEGNLHAVSAPGTLSFWEPTARISLSLDDLAGKTVRLFVLGENAVWTSLSITSPKRDAFLFSALRVRVEGADIPCEVSARGTCELAVSVISPEGAPTLEYGASCTKRRTVLMKKTRPDAHQYWVSVDIRANEAIAYRVTTKTSVVEGTACRMGYARNTGVPAKSICFYVSPSGDDAFSGRLPKPNARGTDGPFATIRKAQRAIRSLKQRKKPVTVWIRAGTYELNEPLVFTPADSGTAVCPVIYSAYPGETVVVSGGRKIQGRWCDAGNGIFTCRVPAPAKHGSAFRQLFADGKRLPRTRLPREGYFHFGAIADPSGRKVPFSPGDLVSVADLSHADVVMPFVWHETRYPAACLNRRSGHLELSDRVRGMPDRYFLENVIEGLDVPGAWHYDAGSELLSWHPESGVPDTVDVVAPYLRELVRFQGKSGKPVHHITLRGLTFSYSDWSEFDSGCQAACRIESSIAFEYAEFCCLRNNRVCNIGAYGIGLFKGCKQNALVGNEIAMAGAGGIRIGLTDPDETTAENAVIGNHIHDNGEVYPSAIGIWIGQSSRNLVCRNRLHHLPYTGISVGWTWGPGKNTHKGNRIIANDIRHVMQRMHDGAGIYLLGVSYGTVVRNNSILDVEGGQGIYLDEGSTGIKVSGNLMCRCLSGLNLHGTRDNTFTGNAVINMRECAINLGNCHSYMRENRFRRNLIYCFGDGPLIRALGWNRRFVVESGENLFFHAQGKPLRIVNIPGMATVDDWVAAGYDTDTLLDDPLFEDIEHDDYRLRPESPVLKRHWEELGANGFGSTPQKDDANP